MCNVILKYFALAWRTEIHSYTKKIIHGKYQKKKIWLFEKNFLRVSRFRFYNTLYICFNVYGKHSLYEIRYRILWWIPIVHIALLIVNLFLVLSVYIHTVTCYTLYLSQVSCTVARGNPPFSILNFSRIHYLRSKWIY